MSIRLGILLVGFLSLCWAQPIQAVFGLLEGNGNTYPHTGLYYRWEDPGAGAMTSGIGDIHGVEPFGNDLAYDPRTKLLFVVGGSNPTTGNWRGTVYALDIWRSQTPLSTRLDSIGARRIAVKDTLLLVTRYWYPYFTAYRISYNPALHTLQLDSLWSPVSPLLRNVPDGLLVRGDTAFISISYSNTTFLPDSLVLAINLRNRTVAGSWQVYPNPNEIVRIGGNLYVQCFGNFSSLRVARITPSSPVVTVWNTGYQSLGGFATDTGGVKDTILFWNVDTLRAFHVTTGQIAPGAYLGITSTTAPFSAYGLMWVGRQLWLSFTNYSDTSLIVFRDPIWEPTPPHFDTAFVSMGLGGVGYPSLRRFIYVSDDTSRTTTALAAFSSTPGAVHVWPTPTLQHLFWKSQAPVETLILYNAQGQMIRRYTHPVNPLPVEDLPAGLYFLTVQQVGGGMHSAKFFKE
ncbi:MAG: T9SS type A sorting domain-containing protein [Bacteroidia bacterium]|nr:T9SS type A sorting domain-containing protein [Bacteroidia bacterium]